MFNAVKDKLASFFHNDLQFEIPFFQRRYVWTEENWQTLWEHLESIVAAYQAGVDEEHFVGTVITKQKASKKLDENVWQLIDGQQRLTTFTLLLKAIADTVDGTLPNLRTNLEPCFRFTTAHGQTRFRILHNRYDRHYFERVLGGENLEDLRGSEHNIPKAYFFFRNKLETVTDEQRYYLFQIVTQKVPVIHMALGANDDEQQIFDTINSLGVRLTTAELLKNHVFSAQELQQHYDELWHEVFEDEEDDVEFWNRNKTAGRIVRTNIELFLYAYLIIQTGTEVKLEDLFREYKRWLKDKTTDEVLNFLHHLNKYAVAYRNMPAGKELNELKYWEREKRLFHAIEELQVNTIMPLVLYICKQIESAELRLPFFSLLESYLIRRMICNLTNKSYNRLFITILNHLRLYGCTYDVLLECLLSQTEDTNRMPNDDEFNYGIHNTWLYNNHAKEVLFFISLHQLGPQSDTQSLSSSSYTLEHIMPKKWEANWNKPDMSSDDKANRQRALRSLGNLTLATGGLNSKMRNASWAKKRKDLRTHSRLNITLPYTELEVWNEDTIRRRADELFAVARVIWPQPATKHVTA